MKAKVDKFGNVILETVNPVGRVILILDKRKLDIGIVPVSAFSSIGKKWFLIIKGEEIQECLTDPVMVAVGRRLWNSEEIPPYTVEVPSKEVALAELASGEDLQGRIWPVPNVLYIDFADMIEQLNRGVIEYVVSN
jgi:hypothetical protein